MRAALACQYQSYLANLDPNGATRTSYVYRLTPTARTRPADGGGRFRGVWLPLGIAVGLAVAALAGLVLWAHS